MKQIYFQNPDSPDSGTLTVTFPISPDEYSHVINSLEQMKIGDALERDCKIVDLSGWPPVLYRMCGTLANIDELDFLARRLESFDSYEIAQYQGTVFLLNLHDITDLINQTYCCQEATVITDFSNLESIGIKHYLSMHDGCTTEELQNVDGVETAYLLCESGSGEVTPYGVVYKNLMQPAHVYDGIHFPEYAYFSPKLIAAVTTGPDYDHPIYLYLPMPKEQICRYLARSQCSRGNIKLENCGLPASFMPLVNDSHRCLFDLNDLCDAFSELNDHECSTLEAVIQFVKPASPSQLAQLIRNLDQFDFYPDVNSAESYGRYMIQDSGHFEFDENLDDYYNYEAYGSDHMRQESGMITEHGYVVYHGTLSLDELMMEDPSDQEPLESSGMNMS